VSSDGVEHIKQGTRIVVTSAFKSAPTNVPGDPTTVELRINPPPNAGGNITIPSTDGDMAHTGPGVFEYAHLPDVVGRWIYAWVGVSALPDGINAVDELQVIVERRAVD
jgi:hypothetical protein